MKGRSRDILCYTFNGYSSNLRFPFVDQTCSVQVFKKPKWQHNKSQISFNLIFQQLNKRRYKVEQPLLYGQHIL
jgi:hypothetical protein